VDLSSSERTISSSVTPTRDGITLVTASPIRPPVKPSSQAAPSKKKSPSNRRETHLPAIVRVATGVTQKIAEASLDASRSHTAVAAEVDYEQLMSAPCYIYFEEHHDVRTYVKAKTTSSFNGFGYG